MLKLNFTFTKPLKIFFLIFLFFVVTYWRVPLIFFVQDEWLGLGLIIEQGFNIVFRGLADEKVFHFIPVGNFLNFLSFNIFNLNYQFYNLIGLLLHFINGILVYKLAKKIFIADRPAILTSIIFITSSVASQLIMWPVVSLNTLALSFALLAWIYLFQLKKTSNYLRLGIQVATFVLLSTLIVEYAIGLFVFIPLAAIIYMTNVKIKQLFIFLLPLLIISVLYFSIRIYPFVLSHNASNANNLAVANFVSEKMIKLPLQYIGQVFIPQKIIESQADLLSSRSDKQPEDFFTKITLIQGILVLILMIILLLIKKLELGINNWRRNTSVSLIFILSSSLPFLLVPGIAGNFTLYPPRYLYFGLVGGAVIMTFMFSFIMKVNRKGIYFASLIIFLYISYNIWLNWVSSNDLYKLGKVRLGILNSIQEYYPHLPKRVIFYTESDRSYYGLPENERIFPFQSGLGQTLLIWYRTAENWPKDFYKDKFLWEIKEQGYREIENRGFGYFRDFDLLTEVIKKNNIDLNSIISFRYDSNTNLIEENTTEIRGRILGYFAQKKEVNLSTTSVSSLLNSNNVYLAIDNNRKTYWDSEVPYLKQQSLEVDLKEEKEITQVDIDSYNNKDQNKVGYAVYLSNDNYNWRQAFFAKVFPPDKNGISHIYFKPEKAQYIRIEQKGFHQFASWVVHEIKIYEKID